MGRSTGEKILQIGRVCYDFTMSIDFGMPEHTASYAGLGAKGVPDRPPSPATTAVEH